MQWLSQLNDAINYLEEHLDDEIDLARVAQIAECSTFHFQRVFSYVAGVPLAEYIRRRRMTRAAFDLQNTEEKVIDIALKYGYDSPTSFNRAFQSIHGVAPTAARAGGIALKAYPPISFKITIKGEAEMNYRIEKKDAFRIVGPKITANHSPESEEGFTVVPKFWGRATAEGLVPKLCMQMDSDPKGVLGVSVGDWANGTNFDYYIAVASTQPAPEGMEEYEVPACTWAIFECKGAMPDAMQNLQRRIVTEWLPTSGYKYADAPDIEQYCEGDQRSDDYVCWVWLPVEKA